MIGLRMFTEPELSYFAELPDARTDPFSHFGFRPITARARHAENQLLSPRDGTLAVDLDGAVIGDVQWRAVGYGPPPMSDAFNIGIRLLESYRGQGHGTQAQAQLATYLLATYPVNRIEASTDVSNIAEQRSLTKAGFSRDGVLRGAQWRAGDWHDLMVFSRLRADASIPGPAPD